MKSILKPILFAAVLATAGISAFSSGSHGNDADLMGQGMHKGQGVRGHMNAEKMKARMAKRQSELKTALKITAAQEPAWTAFSSAMAPPAESLAQRPSREEMAKMTTPERIDKMKAMRTERHAVMSLAMDKRADATKALYAALTPEQQKVFDEKSMRNDHGNAGKKWHHDGKAGMVKHRNDAS